MVRLPPETLAALLDGTLGPDDRAAALREIARSPEAYAEFVEAQAVLAALDSSSPVDIAPALHAHSATESTGKPAVRRRARYLVPALLAAAVVVVMIQMAPSADPFAVLRNDSTALDGTSAAAATNLGATWIDPAWSNVRGGEGSLSAEARAFRLGAQLVTLDVAARGADTTAVRVIAFRIDELLRAADGGVALAVRLATLLDDRAILDQATRSAFLDEARRSHRTAFVDLGACLELARLDGLTSDTDSDGSDLLRACRASTTHGDLDASESWRATVGAVRSVLSDDTDRGPAERLTLVRDAFARAPR